MNDTSEIIQQLYYDKFAALSGEERIKIASDSFDAARKIVLSSLAHVKDDFILRKKLLFRFYGDDLTKKQLSEFLNKQKELSSSME